MIQVKDSITQGTLTSNLGLLNSTTAELSRKLCSMMSSSSSTLSSCFFVSSASEANDLALALAFCGGGADEIISIDKSDHGNSLSYLKMAKDKCENMP